jgi:hypothetical protein
MLTFKLITYANEVRFGVTTSSLEAGINSEYGQDDAKSLIRKFHDMMFGITVGNVNGETEIYPHDIAAIFSLLKIPVKFIDDNGNEVAVSASGSGIFASNRTSF